MQVIIVSTGIPYPQCVATSIRVSWSQQAVRESFSASHTAQDSCVMAALPPRLSSSRSPSHLSRPCCILALNMVPVTPTRTPRCRVVDEAVLEVVEDGKLLAGHNVGVGRGLEFGPDLAKSVFEDLANGWVRGAICTLAGNLEGLDNRRVAGTGD